MVPYTISKDWKRGSLIVTGLGLCTLFLFVRYSGTSQNEIQNTQLTMSHA